MKLAKVTEVNDCRSIDAVLTKSGTNWEPTVRRITAIDQSGALLSVQSRFSAIVRPDTMQVLGTCTDRYRANNHVAQLTKLDGLVTNGTLVPTQVSVWDNGHLMAFQFKAMALDREIRTAETAHDTVSPLLTLAFYNDGKHGDMSFFADFRWFCMNQLGMVAKANLGNSRASHRGNVQLKYEDMLMTQIADMQKGTADRYRQMQLLTTRKIGGRALLEYFAHSLAIPNVPAVIDHLYEKKEDCKGLARNVRAVMGCYRNDDCGAPGTAWQAFNAVTRYVTHEAGRNAATRSARALLGTGQAVADRAFKLARAA
jgi:hypothetical protein